MPFLAAGNGRPSPLWPLHRLSSRPRTRQLRQLVLLLTSVSFPYPGLDTMLEGKMIYPRLFWLTLLGP